MLRFHFSNRLESLTSILLTNTRGQTASVFAPLPIIVPTAAMQRYLTLEMAQRQGICANVQFDYLAQWLWRQLADRVAQPSDKAPYDARLLVWRVFAALSDPDWSAQYPRLAAYVAQADPMMCFALAQQMTLLFEQYLTYRPDWLEAWARGGTVAMGDAGEEQDQQWQSALWQHVCAAMASSPGNPAVSLAQALAAAPTASLDAADTVHVFALPTLAPLHLTLLQMLGQHVPIEVYLLNPCREYWFDVVNRRRLAYLATQAPARLRTQPLHHDEGNRLLAAWGQQTQAGLTALMEVDSESAIDDAYFVENAHGNLLAHLQNAVLDLRDLASASIVLGDNDRSVEVHVCHSLSREIEVLHARLLGLFAVDDAPAPHDVLVVTPDIDAAAPLIDAIFGTAPRALQIPYTVTGRARTDTNAPARAFMDLLALAGSRCTVSDLFGVLQQPVVARRFGLGSDDLDQVREWLQRAGVHWALDGTHRASYGVPAVERHSVADGLARLIASYALPGEVDQPFAGLLPAADIEGSAALSLGALAAFLEAVTALHRATATPLLAQRWGVVLAQALEQFLLPAAQELEDLRELQDSLEQFDAQLRHSDTQQALPLELVRVALAELLDDPVRGGVPTGMVTFTSMQSLRNLPYRVICAIGLNDAAFPANTPRCEFDLMARQARPGDRQRRLDERNVFLDLLLSARHTLHLSYVGRSVRDNAVLPPSVLLSELLEYLIPAIAEDADSAAGLAQARARLVVEHPLQPFAEIAFNVTGDVRLRSFHSEYALALAQRQQALALAVAGASAVAGPVAADMDTLAGGAAREAGDAVRDDLADESPAPEGEEDSGDDGDDLALAAVATPFFDAPLPPAPAHWHDVSLQQLLQFLSNPCRYLLEQRLGLTLPRAAETLEDDEPLLPVYTTGADLAQRLLPRLLEGADEASVRALALAGVELPTGALGDAWLTRELDAMTRFAGTVRQDLAPAVLRAHTVQVACDIDSQPWRLHAELDAVRASGLVQWRFDAMRPRDLLSAWLHHLVLCADTPDGVAAHSVWHARDGSYRLLPCPAATELLHSLLRLYAQGLRAPLYFFPKAAWAYIRESERRRAAESAWYSTSRKRHAENADPAYRLALRGLADPLGEGFTDFAQSARTVFGSMLPYLRQPG